MFPPFPTEQAHCYCGQIISKLRDGSLHLTQVSAPSGERDGHGIMIGVLVCTDSAGEEVVLYTVSGSSLIIEGCIHGYIWVPPVVSTESLMLALAPNDKRIHELTAELKTASERDKRRISGERAVLTTESLKAVHSLYHFHCGDGSVRTLSGICTERAFQNRCQKLPPTGTGDCCAPKLLDYAFAHTLLPVSMDEVYYGRSSVNKVNGMSYEPCDERCGIILPAILGLTIIYRDRNILVVNKQSGLLSVPGRGPEKQDCIVNRMRRLFPGTIEQPSVHRLDMETSGLMVLAFTAESQRNLSMQFERGDVRKQYVALLDGVLEHSEGLSVPPHGITEGVIQLKFSPDWPNRPRRIYDDVNGKLGITGWKKLGYNWYRGADGANRKVTRILYMPHTGRTHQLRLASSDIHGFGLPIVGDALYGKCESGERLMLHAQSLSFIHPVTGLRMEFMCPAPF
ncbi:MAG: RluA family pseudouridine synthase [Treponema sp.]|nr:RluA family pseudouridine synthase [Treponema sp.]